tara:strand:- start:145 stop:354 length:210 start_codon:yes stop_codon:yes gene_type:complete
MRLIKVQGHRNYVRDKNSGAILNINKAEIEEARKRKAERLEKDKEIESLKNEVSDIKSMLTKVIEKLDG